METTETLVFDGIWKLAHLVYGQATTIWITDMSGIRILNENLIWVSSFVCVKNLFEMWYCKFPPKYVGLIELEQANLDFAVKYNFFLDLQTW